MANRPDVSRVWAIESPSGVIDPDARIPNKVVKGWEAEIPPYQFFNWYQQQGDLFRLAAAERGIPAWGEDVTYMKGALSFYDPNGLVYVSLKVNKGANPETDTTAWARSAIQITQNDVDAILNLIETHIADKANPHSVTAEQVGAYDKQQINDLLNSEQGEIDAHIKDYSNPHKVTATQAGGVPVTGGTYTGQINTQADKFIVGKGSAGDETGVSSANGIYLYKGSRKLGINQANKPVFNDGSTEHNLLYDTNFAAKKLETEPSYYVPEPVVHLPLRGDTNLYSGIGSSSFSRASSASYISKSGVLKYAGVDEPRFEKDGMLFEPTATNEVRNSIGDGTSTGWSKFALGSSGVTPNQPSPDGLSNAVKIQSTNINGGLFITSNLNKHKVMISLWLKGATGEEHIRFGFDDSNTTVKLTRGWKRYSFYASPKVGTNIIIYGNGTFYIFGVQQEATEYVTSYIRTNGSPATRVADKMSFESPESQDKTISFGFRYIDTGGTNFSDVLKIDNLELLKYSGTAQWFKSGMSPNGVIAMNASNVDKSIRCAVTRNQNNVTTYLNGHYLSTANSSGATLKEGCILNNSSACMFYLSDFRVWSEVLTPEQISTL